MRTEPSNNPFESNLENAEIVVDTSTLLLGGTALLSQLPKSQLIIPAVVIMELEGKRSHPTVGVFAREWLRLIEDLRRKYKTDLVHGAISEENRLVVIRIEPNHKNQKTLPEHLQDGSHDSTILAVAKNLADERPDARVVVLSNDLPLRLHATLDLGMEAVEYGSSVAHGVRPFSGLVECVIPQHEYAQSTAVNAESSLFYESLVLHNMEDRSPSHAVVRVTLQGDHLFQDFFIYDGAMVRKLPRHQKVNGIAARTAEQDVAIHYLKASADDIPIVSLIGGAGTGKTLLSVANGLEKVRSGEFQKIVIFRSLHEMGQGQEMGFLPGDVDEKMAPWAGAIRDAVDVVAHDKALADKLFESIEISPITYLRGRSLSNCYIILEEAQNFSRNELLNILSRVGEGTKIVLTSDSNQVDNKFLQSGPRSDIWSVVDSLKNESIFAHVTLVKTERSRVAAVMARLLES